MIKVYLTEIIKDLPIIELLRPNLNISTINRFTERYPVPKENIVTIVSNIGEADYIIIPHNYNLVRYNTGYLSECRRLISSSGKKCIIFFPGDDDSDVPIDRSLIFRNSKYSNQLKDNEFIIPAYSPDLGEKYGFSVIEKGDKPSISFCGWTRFPSKKSAIKSFLKYIWISVLAILNFENKYKVQGLWFRKRAIKILRNSKDIETKFIERDSYSGNEKTIRLDTELAEKEFVQNLKSSIFALSIKGNGNFSSRFYEALSLGRLPLLLDTSCVLPLPQLIDYSKFIVNIDYAKIKHLPRYIVGKFNSFTNEDIVSMQKIAYDTYNKYLRIDRFFATIFNEDIWYKYIDKRHEF